MIYIQEITDQIIWNQFFDQYSELSFLQSWEWAEFQKLHHTDTVKLGIYDKTRLAAIVLVEKIRSRRGSFLFIPYGPVSYQLSVVSCRNIIAALKDYLIQIAQKEKFSFIRIAPPLIDTPEHRALFSNLGFKKAPIYMHAERMWVLELDRPEEELLKGMRKTTRYLIKRAERDNVTIEKRTDKQAVDDFMKLYEKTADRERFIGFSKEYIQNEFEAFNKTGNALFLFGRINDTQSKKAKIPVAVSNLHESAQYLAAALIIFTKHAGFYHQGASIHTKFPVPYRLQWEAIREAKNRGCRQYNFWGILHEGRTPKNWGGLTMFKQGFGGRQIDYVPTQDYIISPLSHMTFAYERYLRWRRGV